MFCEPGLSVPFSSGTRAVPVHIVETFIPDYRAPLFGGRLLTGHGNLHSFVHREQDRYSGLLS